MSHMSDITTVLVSLILASVDIKGDMWICCKELHTVMLLSKITFSLSIKIPQEYTPSLT